MDDKWYSPDATYFRVTADDGNLYVLRHDEVKDEWTMEAFRKRAVKRSATKVERESTSDE